MLVKRIVAGIYGANCYLLMDEDTKEIGIIDPGGDSDDIIKSIEYLNGEPKFILLTHGHVDHVGGVMDLKEKYNIPFYLNEEDEKLIKAKTYIYGDIPSADFHLKEDDIIKLGKYEIKVIETPGHTPGGVCFLVDNMLFTGDTLFKGSIGRTDFGGGDYETIMDSINNKVIPLGGHIKVMPGHGLETDLSYEKTTNPFFR